MIPKERFHLDPQVIANDTVVVHEHTREVLAEIGYAEKEIGALCERGVVACGVAP